MAKRTKPQAASPQRIRARALRHPNYRKKNGVGRNGGGRQKGTKDKIPHGRTVKASVKAMIEEVVQSEHKTLRDAFVGGIKGGPRTAHFYLRMAAEYTDGKPADTVNLTAKFAEDELANAKLRLDKKVAALVTTILDKRKAEEEDEDADS
jgi:hypothetical protein